MCVSSSDSQYTVKSNQVASGLYVCLPWKNTSWVMESFCPFSSPVCQLACPSMYLLACLFICLSFTVCCLLDCLSSIWLFDFYLFFCHFCLIFIFHLNICLILHPTVFPTVFCQSLLTTGLFCGSSSLFFCCSQSWTLTWTSSWLPSFPPFSLLHSPSKNLL